MAGTVIADKLEAASTSTLVLKNGVASTPPTVQDSAGTEIGTFCRAWVNFNGTSTVAIRASFNVTSITDNGSGDYTVNFTTAMPDANYSANGTAKIVGGTGGQNVRIHNDAYATSVTTTALKIQVTNAANAAVADSEMVNIAIHR